MGDNLEDDALRHWHESRERHAAAWLRLERSSLQLERFEGWALDMLVAALSDSEPVSRTMSARAQVRPILDDR